MQNFQLVLVLAFFSCGLACDRLIGPRCSNRGLPVHHNCPLRLGPPGNQMCYKLITAPNGSAYTRLSAKRACKKLGGKGRPGFVADITNESDFHKVWCYIAEETSPDIILDPKILLGMKYKVTKRRATTHDGQPISYRALRRWGNFRPLEFGSNFVMRGDCKFSRTKLLNFGARKTLYPRVLCEYSSK